MYQQLKVKNQRNQGKYFTVNTYKKIMIGPCDFICTRKCFLPVPTASGKANLNSLQLQEYILKLHLCEEAFKKNIKVVLAHQTLQTKTMRSSYKQHKASVASILELYFPPSHLPSVGCFGVGSWDLASPRLPLMDARMEKVGGWSHAHSLSPV